MSFITFQVTIAIFECFVQMVHKIISNKFLPSFACLTNSISQQETNISFAVLKFWIFAQKQKLVYTNI